MGKAIKRNTQDGDKRVELQTSIADPVIPTLLKVSKEKQALLQGNPFSYVCCMATLGWSELYPGSDCSSSLNVERV